MSAIEPGRPRDHVGAAHGIEAQPDDAYFDVMASVADNHWWYRGRRSLVARALRGIVRPGCVALDVGCGTAENIAVLESLGTRAAVGTDLSDHALGLAITRRPRPRVVRSLAEDLPFGDGVAGCLVSMDVIEHLDDDLSALREYRRVLEPGAPIVLTVPAYEWLWSEHDDRAFHRRRYAARTLEQVAREAGIVVDRVTYYYSFLVPAAVLLRRTPLRHLVGSIDEEVSTFHPFVEAVLAAMASVERWVARWVRIPFGLSVLLVGHTPR